VSEQFDIRWIDRGRPPKVAPNQAFPDGVDIDLTLGRDGPSCTVALPYPTGKTNIGAWLIVCRMCRLRVGITAASRPDDPRSVKLACKIHWS